MHRTSGFTRLLSGEGRSLSRYESLESEQELDNLNPHSRKSIHNVDPAPQESDIYGWPRGPTRLQRAPKADRFSALFLMLFPLPFIGLVIAAMVLNNKPQSGAGEDVFWAMRLGPTVYPLVFASVAGTTLRTIALWKAERGTTVGTLERLLGSHTFVHAIENAVAMRLWSVLTFVLLALWALSPLGGQGSLRLMYVTNSTDTTEGIPIVYTQPDLTIPHIRDNSTDLWAGAVPRFEIDHIISASLTVSDAWRDNPVDPWGRPKIPLLKGISDAGNKASSEWVNVVPGRDTTFTSLVGLGIPSFTEALAQGEFLNFTTPFEYLEATCVADTVVKLEDVRSYIRSYGSIAPRFRRNSTDPLDTVMSPRPSRTGGMVRSNFFLAAGSPKNTTSKRSDEAPLVWGIFGLGGMHIYHCSLRMFRVDVATRCQGSVCTAQAVRPSKTTDDWVCSISDTSGCLSDLVKPFSLPLRRFLEFLPTAMSGNNDFNCPVYEYLFGYPPQPARDPLTPAEQRDWSQVSETLMSSRLTTLINTFWYAWLWNDEVYTRSAFDSHDRYANTTATRTRVSLIYKVDKGWAAALFLSAGVLLALSAINSIILFRLRGPDPFGYMSVLLREGMHSGVPKTGTALNGYELARMLAHEEVQLTDVQPEEDVGRIALKRMGKHERRRKELNRLRLYV